MNFGFLTGSDEVFAYGSGVVNPVHCLTRSEVAVFSWRQTAEASSMGDADRVEVRFHRH